MVFTEASAASVDSIVSSVLGILGESDGYANGQASPATVLQCTKVLVRLVVTEPFGTVLSGSARVAQRAVLALSGVLLLSNVSSESALGSSEIGNVLAVSCDSDF